MSKEEKKYDESKVRIIRFDPDDKSLYYEMDILLTSKPNGNLVVFVGDEVVIEYLGCDGPDYDELIPARENKWR